MEKGLAVLDQQANNLLALDQASQTSGFAVFKNKKLVDYGKFTFSDDDIAERLVKIRNKIIELIEEYNITEVAFEDIQMQSNVETFKVLSEVYGVILELLQERKMKYIIISSNTWKSTLNIKGRTRPEQKRNAQEYVLNTYGLKVIQDTCDAICIGTHVINNPGQGTKRSKEAGFDWSK